MDSDSSGVSGDLGPAGFRILDRVGVGGYSNVFKALDISDNQIVALKKVKIFHPKEGLPDSVYREVKIFQLLSNQENIISLKKVVRDSLDNIYLVLEYTEFDLYSLIHLTHTVPHSIPHFVHYARQIFQSIFELHSRGYAHCDIKPSNVLLTRDNVIKLADFGLCRLVNTQTNQSTKIVTPSYRSPELLLGDTHYHQAVDIWSLACLLYEMITGFMLFLPSTASDESQLESIFKITGTPPQDSCLWQLQKSYIIASLPYHRPRLAEIFDQTIPDDFSSIKPILISMLDLDPTRRLSIDEIMADPFFANDYSLPYLDIQEIHSMDSNRQESRPKKVKIKKLMHPLLDLDSLPIPIHVF